MTIEQIRDEMELLLRNSKCKEVILKVDDAKVVNTDMSTIHSIVYETFHNISITVKK